MKFSMHKLLLWITSVIILPLSLAAQAKPSSLSVLSAAEVFKANAKSVYLIEIFDKSGKQVATGSAVAVDSAHVVTNAHVVENGAAFRLVSGKTSWPATLVNVDEAHDLARLKVASPVSLKPVKTRNSETLEVGERVFAIGAPRGLELTISEGLISGIRPYADFKVIQTSAPVSHGSSGGALFDHRGALIGITTFVLAEAQNLNFAIPSDWIGQLPKQPQYKTWSSDEFFKKNPISNELELFRQTVRFLVNKEYPHALKSAYRLRDFQQEVNSPNLGLTFWIIGQAHLHKGENMEAKQAYERAISLEPDKILFWEGLLSVFVTQENSKDARACLYKIIALDADNVQAWNMLAALYLIERDDERFLAAYRKLRIIAPEKAEAVFKKYVERR